MDIVIETSIIILLIVLAVLLVLLGLCTPRDKDERTDESSRMGEEDSE